MLEAVAICLLLNTAQPNNLSEWTIYITNDNCPDYTWGFTEEQTRQAFADIVKSHLDEMNRTDKESTENQDRYNMAVTQEALCFVEKYPERKDELIQRIKEGRIYVSPYLCNSLWALQSFESAIRTFYPARRLEKEWGINFDVAEHIEEPSLPWGVASILAGCGIKWLSNPFYAYDSTFKELINPSVFIYEGPDGSQIKVAMDPWACLSASYMQGSRILGNTGVIKSEWLTHYSQQKTILASGTHGDINPNSGSQTQGFANGIINYNNSPDNHPKLVNAILPQFCSAIDKPEGKSPFMTTIKGCFGHSWDLWPVSLAKYVIDMRENDRTFLSAESLISMACQAQPEFKEATQSIRERAEWCLSMLSDHAWNGTDDNNKRHNADLRRKWNEELSQINQNLIQRAWKALKLKENNEYITLFNSLSVPRAELFCIESPEDINALAVTQFVKEDDKSYVYFMSPEIAGFGFKTLKLGDKGIKNFVEELKANDSELESPYYHLKLDSATGGISSLVYKPTGTEIVEKIGRTLCQTVYFDSQEHILTDIKSEVVAIGDVLARLKVTGTAGDIKVTNLITVYQELDRVDFDIRINKSVTTKEERLCQVFPILKDDATLRIETTGAVIRPKPQPEGDLLIGADTRRFAVQGFIDASTPDGFGVTIAPLDAFVLRLDLDQITFEALGNDQNYREVVKDQNGITDFRFRYSLTAHTGGYNEAKAFAWSRSVANPLLTAIGFIDEQTNKSIVVSPERAIATCMKPAKDDGYIMRLWETGGKSDAVEIDVKGYQKVIRTDLLERDQEELPIVNGKVKLNINAHGFASLRLIPF
jgi:alpha-mannosidase